LIPAAQAKVADAEVGTLRNLDGLPQSGQESEFDVVKKAWHKG
jgi:hypothetical protein